MVGVDVALAIDEDRVVEHHLSDSVVGAADLSDDVSIYTWCRLLGYIEVTSLDL